MGTPYFYECLGGFDFPGSDMRRGVLASIIADNDFDRVHELGDADHPQEWLRAEEFSSSELEFIWRICKRLSVRPRSRSRTRCHPHMPGVCVGVVGHVSLL